MSHNFKYNTIIIGNLNKLRQVAEDTYEYVWKFSRYRFTSKVKPEIGDEITFDGKSFILKKDTEDTAVVVKGDQ